MKHSNATRLHLNDMEYRVAHYPNSGADPAIFLIGNLQEIESVDNFSKAFQEEMDVYCVELPGCGLTAPLHACYGMAEHAELLAQLVEHLQLTHFHLLVFSYSTPIALEYCRKYPGRVMSLALGGSMADIPSEKRGPTLSLVNEVLHDRTQFADSFIGGLTSDQCTGKRHVAIRRAALRKCRQYTDSQIWCFIENTVRICAYQFHRPEEIDVPHALCFTGALDVYVKPAWCRKLAESIGADFTLIDGCDHLFHLEQPDITASLMMRPYFASKQQGGLVVARLTA